MRNSQSVYVLINGNVVIQPAEKACPWNNLAVIYAATILEGQTPFPVIRESLERAKPANRRSLAFS